MEKIRVIIERATHNYSAYLPDIDAIIISTGDTIEEIKRNIREAVDLHIEVSREDNCYIPEQLRGDYELEFELDTESVLDYYDRAFGKPVLEKITGVSANVLWDYVFGKKSSRPATREKINRGLHNLGQELLMLHI